MQEPPQHWGVFSDTAAGGGAGAGSLPGSPYPEPPEKKPVRHKATPPGPLRGTGNAAAPGRERTKGAVQPHAASPAEGPLPAGNTDAVLPAMHKPSRVRGLLWSRAPVAGPAQPSPAAAAAPPADPAARLLLPAPPPGGSGGAGAGGAA